MATKVLVTIAFVALAIGAWLWGSRSAVAANPAIVVDLKRLPGGPPAMYDV